jgi:ABC-type thiamine transport system ATPase subunit
MSHPILKVESLYKQYTRGLFNKKLSFSLEADFSVEKPTIIGVMGPNGSGKTTLFELITGGNLPTDGKVLINGQDIHQICCNERDRLAIHYHQSYQVRKFRKIKPDFLMQHTKSNYPIVHLFDEPQFNTQDGYIGFMLDFFRKLHADGCLVFLCMHPNEPFHIDILREICKSFIFVEKGKISQAPDFESLLGNNRVREYLGKLIEHA